MISIPLEAIFALTLSSSSSTSIARASSSLRDNLPTVAPTDRLTVTGREPDSRVYGKRKHAAISRADVTYAEYFQPMEVE